MYIYVGGSTSVRISVGTTRQKMGVLPSPFSAVTPPAVPYRVTSRIDKKTPPPRTLHKAYALGPMVVLMGGACSYERGTPVCISCCKSIHRAQRRDYWRLGHQESVSRLK